MSYSSEVLADSPWGWWRFNDSPAPSGPADSGSSALTYKYGRRAQPGVTALSGTGFAIKGGNPGSINLDFAIARSTTLPTSLNGANVTAAAWVSIPSGNTSGQFLSIGSGSNGWGVGIGGTTFDNTGRTLILLDEGVAWRATSYSFPAGAGTYHIMAVRGASNAFTVYVNGSSVYTGTHNPSTATTMLTIGGGATANPSRALSSAFTIDQVSFHASALSSTRVTAHYNGGSGDTTAVAADSPVSWVKFDESAATAAVDDSSGNSRPLHPSGTPPTITTDGTPISGHATFAASAAVLEAATTGTQPNVFTYEAWVKLAANPSTDIVIVTADGTDSVGPTTALEIDTAGKARLHYFSGSTSKITASTALSLNVWHHIVVSIGAANAKVRVDKTTLATWPVTTIPTRLDGRVMIHATNTAPMSTSSQAVEIAEVAFYTTQLSDTRTDAHYDAATSTDATVNLAGTRQSRTAAFSLGIVGSVSLAGTRQARTAAFAAATVAGVSLAGTRQGRTAAFAATVADSPSLALAGTRQPRTASFAAMVADSPSLALAGTRASRTAAIVLDLVAAPDHEIALAGIRAARTAAFTLLGSDDVQLAGTRASRVAAFTLDAVSVGGDPLDLSAFVDIFTTTTFDGTSLVGGPPGYGKFFIFPLEFDSATAYTVEVDIEGVELDFGAGPVMADSGGFLYSSVGPTEDDVNASNQWTLDGGTIITGGTGTLTFEIGPGVNDWDAAVADGEHYVLFSLGPSNVTAIRISPPIEATLTGTPVVLAGTREPRIAQFTTYVVAPIVEVPIVAAEHAVVVAQAFGPVTLSGTQPVYSIEQAYIPRARTRILMGNVDVTYWRNTLTPAPKYTLVEPLLYGPATIEFPQVAACFGDEPGQGDLWFMAPGERVEIQRVLDDVVVGVDHIGVVTDYDISGRDLTVNIGGEAQGRAELVNRQPVIFPRINDLGHQIADSVRDLGLPHFPALGAVTGIETMTVGGTGHLEHIQNLVAKAWTRSGKQWTCMPDEVTGVYETHRKDTTTIDGTVFLDDARTVANLRRDISEEPNRIFVTCVTPAGQRVRFGVYPGLIQGPVPDFPGLMVIGDTGDGVRLLIGKLHATGYLRLKDVAGGFDQDVAFAVLALQADAGLDEDGEVNEATWNALYDLNITGQSLEWASIQPAAQRRKVRKFNRSATGTIMALNPYYEPERLARDRNIDLGAGVTRDQAREFARTVLHDSDDANWTGTITFKTGALIRGDGFEGMTVTEADVMDARELRPGMNLSLPQFAGGILVHVSAVEVDGEGTVTATVDTRSRDALEVWEVIARNRESRNDPARNRIRKARSSSIVKDSIGEWDEIGGLLGIDVVLEAGWNVFKVVGAAEGTIARIRIRLTEAVEFSCAVFGREVDPGFLDDTVGDPLTEAGQRAWRRKVTRAALNDHWILYSAGTPDEPCGYGADLKTDSAELTGVHDDDAGFRYASEDRTVLHVAVFVRPAGAGAKVEMGRIMWPQLEAGV